VASISRQPGGRRTVQFVGPDGKRHSLRLGKVSQRTAEAIKVKVEGLVSASIMKHAVDDETARWLASIGDGLADKLVAVGLMAPRSKPTMRLSQFLDEYITARKIKKPNTLRNYQSTQRSLLDYFRADPLLSDITSGDCDEWESWQKEQGYAGSTISRNVKRAKQFFRGAVRKKYIAENPMADLKASAQVNKAREHFVTREVTAKVIDACPDAEWRLIVALARYGGFRTPSETFALTRADVDWERERIRVRSPKTEHHDGGESRLIPLFPELRPYLKEVFDQAEPGKKYVITKRRLRSANLRTQLERIIRLAGVEQWPRLFQNLRASRETELTKEHPLHVVVAWMGNSAPIAAKHYLQLTDDDFDKAVERGAESGAGLVQKAVPRPAAPFRSDRQEMRQAHSWYGLVRIGADSCVTLQEYQVPPRGVDLSNSQVVAA